MSSENDTEGIQGVDKHCTVEPLTKPPMHMRSVHTAPPFIPMSDDESVVEMVEVVFVVGVEVDVDDGAKLALLALLSSSFVSCPGPSSVPYRLLSIMQV